MRHFFTNSTHFLDQSVGLLGEVERDELDARVAYDSLGGAARGCDYFAPSLRRRCGYEIFKNGTPYASVRGSVPSQMLLLGIELPVMPLAPVMNATLPILIVYLRSNVSPPILCENQDQPEPLCFTAWLGHSFRIRLAFKTSLDVDQESNTFDLACGALEEGHLLRSRTCAVKVASFTNPNFGR